MEALLRCGFGALAALLVLASPALAGGIEADSAYTMRFDESALGASLTRQVKADLNVIARMKFDMPADSPFVQGRSCATSTSGSAISGSTPIRPTPKTRLMQ